MSTIKSNKKTNLDSFFSDFEDVTLTQLTTGAVGKSVIGTSTLSTRPSIAPKYVPTYLEQF